MACATCDSDGGGCGASCSCDSPLPARIEANGQSRKRMCIKCKERIGSVAVGNQSEPMCPGCLHASILAKFKSAVNNNGLVIPTDKVLVAFSGGPASRVALELLKEIRSKAQCDAEAAKDRGLKVFGLGAVFVDERTVLQLSPADAQAGVDEISSIFPDDGQHSIPLHVVQLECIFDKDEGYVEPSDNSVSREFVGKQEAMENAKEKVVALFQGIQDSTGREDLLEYLRMQAIQKVAQQQGFTKVVLGLSITRIAARVIAATTKGRGFSLSADIQYFDARWPVPVILPLRDCVTRELAVLCYVSKFKTTFIKGLTTMAGAHCSLNNLAHSFVTLLQEENPSRDQTIVRTAAKLKSFSFNEVVKPPNRRRKSSQASTKETSSRSNLNADLDILCSICSAPLDKEYVLSVGRTSSTANKLSIETDSFENFPGQLLEFRSTCCPCCRVQIFPNDGKNASEIYGFFPNDIKETGLSNFAKQQMWMRSQIASYLLPELDDEEI